MHYKLANSQVCRSPSRTHLATAEIELSPLLPILPAVAARTFHVTFRSNAIRRKKSLYAATCSPVNPAEDLGVGRVGDAEGDPPGAVLGQPVLPGDGAQSARVHGQLHGDAGLVRADVVAPQGVQRAVNAPRTLVQRKKDTSMVKFDMCKN